MDPALSIVVAVKDATENLVDITARLAVAGRSDIQIIFVFSDAIPETWDAPPGAEIIEAESSSLVPHLWRDGILSARGKAIGLISAHCIPSEDWVAALLAADLGKYVGVGGAIELDQGCSSARRAIYLLRYLRFAPPQQRRSLPDIAADNAVYRRADVIAHPDLLADGFWEPSFHRRFRRAGLELVLDPRLCVIYRGREKADEFATQRYQHGLEFGFSRSAERAFLIRLAFLLAWALPPLVIFGRIASGIVRRPRFTLSWLSAMPWLVWFIVAWSAGEARGYWNAVFSPAGSRGDHDRR